MKPYTVTGKVKTAFSRPISDFKGADGQPLQPLDFSEETEIFSDVAEAKATKEWLDDSEILEAVNQKRIAVARSKGSAAAIAAAGIKAPTLEDDGEAVRMLVKMYLTRKTFATEAEATVAARKALGL